MEKRTLGIIFSWSLIRQPTLSWNDYIKTMEVKGI